MISEITPILFVLAGAVLVFIGSHLARRWGLSEDVGSGAALLITAISLMVIASRWPAWLRVEATADSLLSYARIVGLTGMLFLAGTRFDLKVLRGEASDLFRVALAAAVILAAAILLFIYVGQQESAVAVLLAATVLASSLWFPVVMRSADVSAKTSANNWTLSALVLSAIAIAVVYFFDIFQSIPWSQARANAYAIVALYESLKLVLLFAFGCFIGTRFLTRAEGRISNLRVTIGFALLAILIFALTTVAANQLVAVAWSFVAGAIWRRSKVGAEFSKSEKPIASALLLAFAFITPLLQLHGRSLTPLTVVPLIFLVGLALKVAFLWLTARFATLPTTTISVLSNALPGEMAILLLGFGVTRWAVDSPAYVSLVGYALLSSLVTPTIIHLGKKTNPAMQARSKIMTRTLKAVCGLLVFYGAIVSIGNSNVLAQQPDTNQNVQLGRGMSVLAPGLMEIGAKTNLFLSLGDKIPLTAQQKKKLENLLFEIQMYTFQKESDLDVVDAEMKRLMTRDSIDLNAVRAKMKEFEEVRVEVSMKKIETLLKAINLLTHEQHTRIILLAREAEQTTKPGAQTF